MRWLYQVQEGLLTGPARTQGVTISGKLLHSTSKVPYLMAAVTMSCKLSIGYRSCNDTLLDNLSAYGMANT